MPTAEQLFDLMRAVDVSVAGESDAVLGEAQLVLEHCHEFHEWTEDGRLVAYVALAPHGQSSLEVDRTRTDLWDEVLTWAIDHGADRVVTRDTDLERLDALHRRGWHDLFGIYDLKRPAAGVDREPAFASWGPDDAPAAHDCIYSVWTDVEGHVHRPIEEWHGLFVGYDGFDPALQVVLRGPSGIDAVALCRIWEDGLGWVSQLAVRHERRGEGLGRGLLLEAVRRMALTGAVEVGLSVNAPNTGALALYESCGFERTSAWITSGRS